MRSFLGVKALRKNPHAATAQPLKYPLTISPPNHREEGAKKKGTEAAKHKPMPPSIMLLAAACDLTNRPQVKSPAKCAMIAVSM
ncbi:hypothetical protein SDC9_71695 [bioreactor metagenome]|uniref:Uncharacterized protein n=1 Tax=bioreactor metagenome TaxID=1076179 RepID=A0A644Y9H3_9ZZZZ